MKKIFIKLLKTLLVFIISTIVIYTCFTLKYFFEVCDKYQLKPFGNSTSLVELDNEMIKELGDGINQFTVLIENELENSIYKNDGQPHTIADGHMHTVGEFFDPLGYSAWSLLQITLHNIFSNYISISIALGIVIAIAYAVITSKYLNKFSKIVIGYIGVITIFPPLYMYSWTHRFWSLKEMYLNQTSIFFYIVYTIIFLLICIINYIISKKITNDLNKTIQ